MIGLKLMTIQDILPITGMTIAPVNPPSLDIVGRNLLQASEVYINGMPAPEFIIVSDNRLVVQIPRGQEDSPISSLRVLAEKPSVDRSSLITFRVGSTFKSLKGIERMVQVFCKLLMQTPGTDRFYPTIGGGLLKLVGHSVSRGTTGNLRTEAVSSVGRTKEQMVGLQNSNRRIPPDERLLSAVADGVGFDEKTTTLALRVVLTAQSGKQAVTNLTF